MTIREVDIIKQLKNIQCNLNAYTYQTLCESLYKIIPQIPIIPIVTDKFWKFQEEEMTRNPKILFRARENEIFTPDKSSLKLPFPYLSQISIIPECEKYKIKKFGRCNKPENPRFYCSNDLRTACIESITSTFKENEKESKSVSVGVWEILEPLNLAIVYPSQNAINQFIANDNLRYSEIIKVIIDFKNKAFENFDFSKYSKEYTDAILDIFVEEFAKIKIESDNDYFLSNFYCDEVFENSKINTQKFDGIIYPSIDFAYQELNMVLHPRAMKKIKFLNAMFVWVINFHANNVMRFNPLERNVKADINGVLQWKKINPND